MKSSCLWVVVLVTTEIAVDNDSYILLFDFDAALSGDIEDGGTRNNLLFKDLMAVCCIVKAHLKKDRLGNFTAHILI